jgi:hypothetical protein
MLASLKLLLVSNENKNVAISSDLFLLVICSNT